MQPAQVKPVPPEPPQASLTVPVIRKPSTSASSEDGNLNTIENSFLVLQACECESCTYSHSTVLRILFHLQPTNPTNLTLVPEGFVNTNSRTQYS